MVKDDEIRIHLGANSRPISFEYYTKNLENQQTTSATYYYHYDLHGNVIRVTNSSGTTVITYTYDALGTILTESNSSSIYNPFTWSGEAQVIHDPEFNTSSASPKTGFYNSGSGYYNPDTGTFLSGTGTPAEVNPTSVSIEEPVNMANTSTMQQMSDSLSLTQGGYGSDGAIAVVPSTTAEPEKPYEGLQKIECPEIKCELADPNDPNLYIRYDFTMFDVSIRRDDNPIPPLDFDWWKWIGENCKPDLLKPDYDCVSTCLSVDCEPVSPDDNDFAGNGLLKSELLPVDNLPPGGVLGDKTDDRGIDYGGGGGGDQLCGGIEGPISDIIGGKDPVTAFILLLIIGIGYGGVIEYDRMKAANMILDSVEKHKQTVLKDYDPFDQMLHLAKIESHAQDIWKYIMSDACQFKLTPKSGKLGIILKAAIFSLFLEYERVNGINSWSGSNYERFKKWLFRTLWELGYIEGPEPPKVQ